jgi:uncharacterized protein
MVSRRRFLLACGGLAAAGLGGYARFVEPDRIEFTQHPAPAGLPSFAQLTDLHLHAIGDMHEAIAAELQRRRPAFVVITGDSIDRRADLPVLADFLAMLPAVPKFAILGNWEHWSLVDKRELARVYDRSSCRLLINEAMGHTGMTIIGVDDLVAGRPDLVHALATASVTPVRMLLAHCPAYRDQLPRDQTFDIVLSGHTHGGQLRVFGFAPYTPNGSGRYVDGWYREASPMYVSRGIGTVGLPVRFHCRPEVAFFDAQA